MIGKFGYSLFKWRMFVLFTSFVFISATGCGDDDPVQSNLCKNVSCDTGGVCDSKTGLCENASDCAGDDNLCLNGYTCDSGTCSAEFPCPEGACARGVCVEEACINPAACQNNANCLEGYFCGAENICEVDPCVANDVQCSRGVCETGTGECVNDVCTSATEDTACLEDHRCSDGTCVDETAFCAGLVCDRGVCSFDDLACSDADNCAGDDNNCLEGSYCADDNSCQPNRCDANGECARGVCEPASGDCVNADNCSSETNCVDGFYCVASACVDQDDACGVGGCPGNQLCAYNDANSTAVCEEEVAGCTSALDCLDDRVCSAGACADPSACTPDDYEPNDAVGEETDYLTTGAGGALSAGICSGDIDRFVFDSTLDAQLEGTVLFDVTIAPTDVGLGLIEIELFNTAGMSVGTATNEDNGVQTGSVQLTAPVTAATAGEFIAIVRDAGAVTTAGVGYSVRLDVVSDDALAACASPITTLTAGNAAAGDTTTGASSSLVSGCADTDANALEDVYLISLDAPAYITLSLTSLNGASLSMDVRSLCEQNESSLECSSPSTGTQSFSIGLEAGEHYVVVQGADVNEAGPYALVYALEPVVCSPADNSCADATTLDTCNQFGTGFDPVTCELGCDATINDCTRPQGDDCAMPLQSTLPIVDELVNHSTFTNVYDPGPSGCVPNNTGFGRGTDGPERVYEMTIPDGKVLVATLERTANTNAYGALYFVTDCGDLDNTCLVGANEGSTSDETLAYYNDTGADIPGFLIVDTKAQSAAIAPTTLNVTFEDRVCVPGATRCVLDRESQVCNEIGTAFDSTNVCDFGCNPDGTCVAPTNETCDTAQVIQAGVLYGPFDIEPYNADYNAVCGVGGSGSNNDAFYRIENVPAGSFVEVVADSETTSRDFDSVAYVVEGCGTTDTPTGCVGSRDDPDDATMGFVSLTGGDYTFGIRRWGTGSAVGNFTVRVDITPPSCSTPGQTLQCNGNDVEFCDANYQIDTYSCSGTCTNGTCDTETGDSCYDAISVDLTADSGSFQGDLTGATNQFELSSSGTTGQCSVSYTTDAPDNVYSFSLSAGELLTVNYNAADYWVVGFFLTNCADMNTCSGQTGEYGGSSLTYYAETAQDVFLVLDTDVPASPATFSVFWTVDRTGNIQCSPNSVSCSDPITLQTCDAAGAATTFSCSTSCTDGACDHDPTETSVCSTATDIGTGGGFIVDWADAQYLSQIDSTQCAGDSDGKEAYFSVSLADTDVLTVTATNMTGTADDPVIYVISDCADADGTCVGGVRETGDSAQLRVQAVGAQTYTVVIDSDNQFTSYDTFYVTFDISPPECVSGSVQCDADDIQECDQGTWETVHTCSDVCSGGICLNPDGDSCVEAAPVDISAGTGTIVDNLDDFSDSVDYGTNPGTCTMSSGDTTGEDAYYAFDLQAGDLLTLNLDFDPLVSGTFADSAVYVLDDCSGPDACLLSAAGAGDERPNVLRYFAETAESIVVGVSRDSTTSYWNGEDFNLDWTISSAICTPASSSCADAVTVQICNDDGTAAVLSSCLNSCSEGACIAEPTTDDLCDGAQVSTEKKVVLEGHWYDQPFTSENDLASSNPCNPTSATTGPDVYYKIPMVSGEVLRAKALYNGGAAVNNDPIIMVFTDCSDIGGTCLTADYVNDATASVEYIAPFDQTVVLAFDGDSASPLTNEGPYRIEWELLTPDCDPATYVNSCNTDGDGILYCDEFGFTRTYDCQGTDTTCNATTSRCTEPVGEFCIDPLVGNPTVIGTLETFTGTLGDYDSDFDLGTGNACTGSQTPGAEPLYAVDLTIGQVLTVSAFSTEASPEDITVYLTSGCDDVAAQCLAGSDLAGAAATPETFTYTAAADETVYVVVDSFYTNNGGDYQLDITVN